MMMLEKYPVPPSGMVNVRTTRLPLVLNHISHLDPYRPSWFRKEASQAIRIRTTENLIPIIENKFKSVQIQVSVRHGLTGLTKVYKQEYSDLSQVKIGNFTYGTKFAVL